MRQAHFFLVVERLRGEARVVHLVFLRGEGQDRVLQRRLAGGGARLDEERERVVELARDHREVAEQLVGFLAGDSENLEVREDLLEALRMKLKREDDPASLITNKGFKRYLKVVAHGKIAIDEKVIREEAARDGLFGILTNASQEELPVLEILRRYKELWMIEDVFGEVKGTLEARPMFHWTDRRIEGHMMICFLAYYLEAYVTQQLRQAEAEFTAPAAFDALNQVRAIPVNVRGQTVWVRTKIEGIAAKILQILKIRIPGDVLKLPQQEECGNTDFEVKENQPLVSNA